MSVKIYIGLFDQDENELTYNDYRRENINFDYEIGISDNKHVIKLFNTHEIKFTRSTSKEKLTIESFKLFDDEDNILLEGLFDNILYIKKSEQLNISRKYLELFLNNDRYNMKEQL